MAHKTKNEKGSSKGSSSRKERPPPQDTDDGKQYPNDGGPQGDFEHDALAPKTKNKKVSSKGSSSRKERPASQPTDYGNPYPNHGGLGGDFQYEPFNYIPRSEATHQGSASSYGVIDALHPSSSPTTSTSTDWQHYAPESMSPHYDPNVEFLPQQHPHTGYPGEGEGTLDQLPEEEWVPDESVPPGDTATGSMSPHDDPNVEFLPQQPSHTGYPGEGEGVLDQLLEEEWMPDESIPPGETATGSISPHDNPDREFLPQQSPTGYTGKGKEVLNQLPEEEWVGSDEEHVPPRNMTSDVARDMEGLNLSPGPGWEFNYAAPATTVDPSFGYTGSQPHSALYPHYSSAAELAQNEEYPAPSGPMESHTSERSPRQVRDKGPKDSKKRGRKSNNHANPVGASGYGQDYEGGQHHPGGEAAGHGEHWDGGTFHPDNIAQEAYDQPSNLAGPFPPHYEAEPPAGEAGPLGETQPLPSPYPSTRVRISASKGKKNVNVTCHRHPDALYPVLCQSVVDRIEHQVERLQDKFLVFGAAYARKRTTLKCAEENAHGELGGSKDVEFYIVSDLKGKFDYNMLFPPSFVC